MPSGRHMDDLICPTTKTTCERQHCMLWNPNNKSCKMGYQQEQPSTKKTLLQIIKEYEDLF
jgi:hypothetical protein